MDLHLSQNMTRMVASIEVQNTDEFQIVYASQLYGTFFVIGAKINLTRDKKSITQIDLALNNYKGLYNIGMLENTEDPFSFKNGKGLITLILSADNGKNSKDLKRTLPIVLDTPLPLNQINELLFTRELKSLTNVTSPEKHLDEGVFDSEFYERNGKFITKKTRLDDYLPEPDMGPVIKPAAGEFTNCMTSRVRLIKN